MASETTFIREVTVRLESGLHLRPCSRIVERVRDYPGSVNIRFNDRSVNAKSMLDLMGLGADCGSVLILEISGNDAATLADAIASLLEHQQDYESS